MEIFRGKVMLQAVIIFAWTAFSGAQTRTSGPAATCFVFVDHQYIWTLEVVTTPLGKTVPILNIITLTRGEWDLRPEQVNLVNAAGKTAEVEQFSMDTGEEGNPYLTNYLKVLGNNFIGVDLMGDFTEFSSLSEVTVELGKDRFKLDPVHDSVYESVASKINEINVDSPDIREDFRVLGIRFYGNRTRIE